MSEHLVVVGGGQAAAQAVSSARQLGFTGKITLIGEEPWLPYQRPPLSKKYLAGEMTRERLALKPEDFYLSRNVELMRGVKVEELELASRRLRLDDGRALLYERLLLATGGRVRELPIQGRDLDGIHYIRTVDDVDALQADFEPGRRLIIVGAGYIGLEVAAVARSRGLEVTVLEAADRVLARVVCPQLSEFYERYHREAGVAIHCHAAVTAFSGSRRVTAVETAGGRSYPCDLVVVGIGIRPNVELAERAGLACDDGIVVDACARTADERVVAAGDCTRHPHPFAGRSVRLESVHNAIEQGKSAAAGLVGESRPFDEVPWFWSDQYDLKLQIAGLPFDYDEVVVRGEISKRGFAAYYLAGTRPVAVEAVNSPRDFMLGKKILAGRASVSAAELADPKTDLSKFAAV